MRIRMGRHKTAVPPKLPPAKQRQGLSFTPLTRANGCGCALCPSEIHRTKRLTAPAPKRQRPPVRAGFHLSRLSSGRLRSPRPLPLRTPRGRTLPHGILHLFDYTSFCAVCQTRTNRIPVQDLCCQELIDQKYASKRHAEIGRSLLNCIRPINLNLTGS